MADDKTRILTAAEAARLLGRKPKVVGDKVVFYCENGHRVVAPVGDGGKRGACSKCGAPLIVPVAEAEAVVDGATVILAAPRQAAAPPADGRGTDEVPSFTPQQAEAAEMPARPDDEGPDVGVEVGPEGDAAAGAGAAAGTTNEAAPQEWQFMEPAGGEPAADGAASADGTWAGMAGAEEGDAEGIDNPTARLVARLWVEHELGGTLELHLQDGSVVFPQSYEPRWSRGTHGLFAAAAPDGSITLTAVAWEAVQKIIVRNVKGLPEGMFE